jgi:hypothetical protein
MLMAEFVWSQFGNPERQSLVLVPIGGFRYGSIRALKQSVGIAFEAITLKAHLIF